MITLRELQNERDDLWNQYTSKMLETVSHVTEAVCEIIDDESAKHLNWQTVDVIGEVVIIVGTVKFPIGYELQLPSGEIISVDEDTQDLIARAVRIGIPLKYAIDPDKSSVKEYLLNNTELPTDVMSEETKAHKVDVEDMNEPTQLTEFDLNSLTEDQIQQMMWHSKHTSPNKVS